MTKLLIERDLYSFILGDKNSANIFNHKKDSDYWSLGKRVGLSHWRITKMLISTSMKTHFAIINYFLNKYLINIGSSTAKAIHRGVLIHKWHPNPFHPFER
jgi:hypothetical protein